MNNIQVSTETSCGKNWKLSIIPYRLAGGGRLEGDRQLLDCAAAQRVPLPLRGEQAQLLLLVL